MIYYFEIFGGNMLLLLFHSQSNFRKYKEKNIDSKSINFYYSKHYYIVNAKEKFKVQNKWKNYNDAE